MKKESNVVRNWVCFGMALSVILPVVSSFSPAGAEGFNPLDALSKKATSAWKMPEKESCYVVQRQILDGLFRYNVFNNLKVDALTPAVLRTLLAQHYLEKMPADPGQRGSTSSHFKLSATGSGLLCTVHGALPASMAPDRKTLQAFMQNPCFHWQLNLSTAITRFNRAKNERNTKIDLALLARLVEEGYLSAIPVDPGQGVGSWSHYQASRGGIGVTCTRHGPAPELIPH
ncbi:MAG: hypothetical protein HY303_22075 [Candidatus Wallbacteria bacterium]|nr:hypothetical protein [Candidatus Wallbacteria bacterium]